MVSPRREDRATPAAPPAGAFRCEFERLPLGQFDLGGVLYHANYYQVYEMGREALLEHIGMPYPQLAEAGCHLTIAEAHQSFLGPITYGTAVTLFVWVGALRRSSVRLEYLIRAAPDDSARHYGWTALVFVQRSEDGFCIRRLPQALRTGLAPFQA